MKNIEVEIRSFIDQNKYDDLLQYFSKEARLFKDDFQETYYFDSKTDLRIQRNKFYAKIWQKEGELHDEARKELEIKFDRDQFEELEELFLNLGYKVQIKWFRDRKQFDWQGITVCLDQTRGYGYIIELEKMSSMKDKDAALKELKNKLKELDILQTPKEEFDKRFEYYKNNWEAVYQEK